MVKAHVLYTGTVQGIGFRFTVQRFASYLGLAGWAKNLHSGHVEMLVEGDKKTIEQLLDQIEQHFQGYIRDKKVSYEDSKGEFVNFEITY